MKVVQFFLALLVICINCGTSLTALLNLYKSPVINNATVQSKQLLLIIVINQFISALILLITITHLFGNGPGTFSKFILVIIWLLLLCNSVIGVYTATILQCFKDDQYIKTAWMYTSGMATNSALGVLGILLIQTFSGKSIQIATMDPAPVFDTLGFVKTSNVPNHHPSTTTF